MLPFLVSVTLTGLVRIPEMRCRWKDLLLKKLLFINLYPARTGPSIFLAKSGRLTDRRWVEFVILWSRKIFFLTRENLEDAPNLNKGCRFWQQPIIESTCREQITRNKTLSIDSKKRLFRLDESRRNRELRRNNQESRLDSRLDSREDRESSVNLLLNCTVRSVVWRDKTRKMLEPRMNRVSKRENRVSSFEKPETSFFYIHYSKGFRETIYFLKNITITICTYSEQTDQQHLHVQFKRS